MIGLKTTEAVFSGTATMTSGSNLTPNIKITNSDLADTELKNVLIIANFDVTAKDVATGFQNTGAWYNLMNNTPYNVSDTNATINLQPGEFRIYGNKASTLGTTDFEVLNEIYLYPNPASTYFTLNTNTSKVEIFSITGQLVKSFNKNQKIDHHYGISDLNNGMYLVRMYNDENQVKVMKFIKQ